MPVPTDEEIEQELSESVKRSRVKFQFLNAIYELLPKALITCEWGEGDPSIVIQFKEVADDFISSAIRLQERGGSGPRSDALRIRTTSRRTKPNRAPIDHKSYPYR